MPDIALVDGSGSAALIVSLPLVVAYRGRAYMLVETVRHGLRLEGSGHDLTNDPRSPDNLV